MSHSATVCLIDVFFGIRSIRLWIHTQYLLVDTFIVGFGVLLGFVDSKKSIDHLSYSSIIVKALLILASDL